MTKRIFDILFSLFIIVFILSWLFPIIALVVLLSSKGPILFRQKRTGFHGKEFVCYKFRTMRENSQAETLQAVIEDPRITRAGHILRELNLDELPQFFNVLAGNMSVVGPRPHMLSHTEYFGQLVSHYNERHGVRPGITGLAQIKGYRGATPDYRSIYKRVQWDIFYVQHKSVCLDLKIIGLTVFHVLKRIITWNG